MAAVVDWVNPPLARGYPENYDRVSIHGSGGVKDWCVLRRFRAAAAQPIPCELIVFSGLSFEEARERAEIMEKYLRGNRSRPPPSWD
jgi:hypothetical protein